MSLPLWSKGAIAVLMLSASQYHFWSRLSSGSPFAPEFPRPIVILFYWALGAITLLAVLQIVLDLGTVTAMIVRQQVLAIPDLCRYITVGIASLIAAYAVTGALRVPPLKDIQVAIRNLPPGV